MKKQLTPLENPIEAPEESLPKETIELSQEKKDFEQEKKEAQERFKDLTDLVDQRYEKGTLSPKEVIEFKQHNKDVLDFSLELGLRKKFNQEEIKILSMAAILHDLTKADPLPTELAHIKNYNLVAHGQAAAQESKEILTDDYLKKHAFENHSAEQLEKDREEVSQAIAQHMGPHPGFMTGILKEVNQTLKKQGQPLIEHPPAQGKIAETLLAADMGSLASVNGRKKVLSIRASGENFQKVDKESVEEYKKMGIDLRQGEAALLSGFESARQAVEMIKNPQDRAWIDGLLEESKEAKYQFNKDPQPVDFETAMKKKEEFEQKEKESKIQSIKEQIP